MAEEKNKKPRPNKKSDEPKITGEEKRQMWPFKKYRGGIELTEKQVQEIKEGRKKLRRDMKTLGIKSKKEFELTASSLGLYFDKNRKTALLWWFLHHNALWLLLGATLLLLVTLFGISIITKMRGHFTVNMSSDLFREGFTLSETRDFEKPTTNLVCTPAENVPDRSITVIDVDVDNYDGQHNSDYFAYTFYIRNEGESTASYKWEMILNSEGKDLSKAAWVMIFEDGKMQFYARAREDGTAEMLPAEGAMRGYSQPPMYDLALDPEGQYEQIISPTSGRATWRLIPRTFVSNSVVAEGVRRDMVPMEIHKYTVVIWLEGDDPDCTNELIGGHLGLEIYMSMLDEEDESTNSSGWKESWREFWESIGGIH